MSRSAIAILSTENLLHNLSLVQKQVGSSKIIAMVKANAYGHGLRSVSQRLDGKVGMLGVASIDEALAIRECGVTSPILLIEGVFEPNELIVAATQGFHVVFHTKSQLQWLDKLTCPMPLKAWIKVYTGMGRLGLSLESAEHYYQHLLQNPKVAQPVRILSQFACADEPNHPLNAQQINALRDFLVDKKTEVSFCNSAGIYHFPQCHYDFVRPGLALYGASPVGSKRAQDYGFKPVMTLQTNLIATHQMRRGESLGYAARYTCPEDMPIGVVAFGYGDGYPFSARDGTPLLINGTRCPLVGRVSMDMLTVDLRPAPTSQVGDPVVLWGEGLPVEEVAAHSDTITNSLLAGVQNRVKFLWTRPSSKEE
jgi:alanine racemase